MNRVISALAAALLGAMAVTVQAAAGGASADPYPQVLIKTSEGTITVELDRTKAPISVENFLAYVDAGHYDGTIFHRVINDFMIQGGGYSGDFERKATQPAIKNEADNGLKNLNGTIAMARTRDADSATAQFFINVNDNAFLDFKSRTPDGWGYAVFGKVTQGMDTVDRIRALPTGHGGPFPKDVPQTPVVIEQVLRLDAVSPADAATADPASTTTTASGAGI